MNSKALSILSYIGILWLVAYFLGEENRTDLDIYHLKQGLGLWMSTISFGILVFVVGMISSSVAQILCLASIIFLILMVMGIIHAVNEIRKPLPIIGIFFEDKFKFIGA